MVSISDLVFSRVQGFLSFLLTYTPFHIVVKGVKRMNDITTLCVRLPKEDKDNLMKYAENHDLSASQIIRQLIRNYLFRCGICIE